MLAIFIRFLSALILAFIPVTAAHAKTECEAWSVAMGEYEEGPELSAGNCGTMNKNPAYLEIRCGGANALNFRFEPGSAVRGSVADPAKTSTFVFETNTGTYTLTLNFEGLDGMYAGYYPANHPIFETLKSGRQLSIIDQNGQYPQARISLSNSRKAIDAVIKHCSKK